MPVRPSIHTIKVSLRYMKPPVWRRLQVPSNTSLAQLHHIIQAAMGWCDCLFDFQEMARRTLARMQVGQRFAYWYDFGDDWWHDITVEAVGRADPALTYPRCVTGRRTCPPEDCGGPWGFDVLMGVLGDEKHPEHEMYRDWREQIGEVDYDPARFDLNEINEALTHLDADALQR